MARLALCHNGTQTKLNPSTHMNNPEGEEEQAKPEEQTSGDQTGTETPPAEGGEQAAA